MLTLEQDTLVFRFPDTHEQAETSIELQITLRIPDDTKEYPLPPGLGRFPLRHTEDFGARVPKEWAVRGGIMLPMFRTEAMWLNFRKDTNRYPCAVKVAAGKINAISGKPWKPELDADDIDYLVIPHQPWLDGFAVGEGQIRQFIAMPLGGGYTAEEQITGRAEWGGLQIIVYPMKGERWREMEQARLDSEQKQAEQRRSLNEQELEARKRAIEKAIAEAKVAKPAPSPAPDPAPRPAQSHRPSMGVPVVKSAGPGLISQKFSHGRSKVVMCERKGRRPAGAISIPASSGPSRAEPSYAFGPAFEAESPRRAAPAPMAMGLGAGGLMRQEVLRDPYGIDAWDQTAPSRCFLTLVQAEDWVRITGEEMRREPPSAQKYAEHGLPWFDYEVAKGQALPGAPALTMLKTVGDVAQEKGLDPLPGNESVDPHPLVKLGPDAGVSLLAAAKETGS